MFGEEWCFILLVLLSRDASIQKKSLGVKEHCSLATQNMGKCTVKSSIISVFHCRKYSHTQKNTQLLGHPSSYKGTWAISVSLQMNGQLHRTIIKLKSLPNFSFFYSINLKYERVVISSLILISAVSRKREKEGNDPSFELYIMLMFNKFSSLHIWQIYPELKHFSSTSTNCEKNISCPLSYPTLFKLLKSWKC